MIADDQSLPSSTFLPSTTTIDDEFVQPPLTTTSPPPRVIDLGHPLVSRRRRLVSASIPLLSPTPPAAKQLLSLRYSFFLPPPAFLARYNYSSTQGSTFPRTHSALAPSPPFASAHLPRSHSPSELAFPSPRRLKHSPPASIPGLLCRNRKSKNDFVDSARLRLSTSATPTSTSRALYRPLQPLSPALRHATLLPRLPSPVPCLQHRCPMSTLPPIDRRPPFRIPDHIHVTLTTRRRDVVPQTLNNDDTDRNTFNSARRRQRSRHAVFPAPSPRAPRPTRCPPSSTLLESPSTQR
ncbi:hypothetical protein R3P38DRAFT_3299838 [Favolaschia claudopus]|uniref:Uncharacterized protein n=1 Tax=Favolaschia claudopus TaxID=2862362 RepID=A0AAV9YZG7_9AGAR